MLKSLPDNKREKIVYVLSSDTLVENPIMEIRRNEVCDKIGKQAKKDDLPLKVKILRPELNDTFWVNLIGRGYPSPNRWFRWCTDRLKIKPMTKYILEQVKENGEVIILLGIRSSESNVRSQTMDTYSIKDFTLRKHATISGAYVYAPIEDWMENDVWEYLLKVPSPWGEDNKDLSNFYRKDDTEIEFIIDKSSPPSGTSRFGCWVCTVVERDRAVEGSIEDGEVWLEPLLEFRNWLKDIRDDPRYREKVRREDKKKKIIANMLGREFTPSEHRGHKVLGPFTFETRHDILKRLIKLQEEVASRGISLISSEEIKAIETIWVYEGDNITDIAEVLGSSKEYSNEALNNNRVYIEKLKEICDKYGVPVQLIEQLLTVEKDLSTLSRRTGMYERLEKVIGEYVLNKMS
jgi:DNA sulfur modification protein DndC